MGHRHQRLEDQLRQDLSSIIQREVKDPRVNLATVSAVELSRDLSHAKVHVSVLGEDAAREAALEGLQRARGFIRGQLARRTHLRITPELHIDLDRGAEHSLRISEILENLHHDDSDGPGTAPQDDPER